MRVEHVIKGLSASRSFYCGGCEYLWNAPDAGKTIPPVAPSKSSKPKTKIIGPKRLKN